VAYHLDDFIFDANAASRRSPIQLSELEVPFKKYLASAELFSTINMELSRAARDALYTSTNLRGNSLIIHVEASWVLTYTLYEHMPAHLYTVPMLGLISPLSSGKFEYDIYDLPHTYSNALFDREQRLINKRSFSATVGDVVRVEGATTVFDVRINQPVGVLKLVVPLGDPLQWAFDRETLIPLQAISATTEASELAFISQVLGVLNCQSSIIKLKELAHKHPAHNVRWEAIKAIGKINPEIGLAEIEIATMDKHPHVAAAAQRTLARYRAN
jgi:hypothetical protein